MSETNASIKRQIKALHAVHQTAIYFFKKVSFNFTFQRLKEKMGLVKHVITPTKRFNKAL
ncbi:MAG: hypothetical protein ACI9GM_000993 [Salibacteraceae bacterium]|jgi:hypothetical protein